MVLLSRRCLGFATRPIRTTSPRSPRFFGVGPGRRRAAGWACVGPRARSHALCLRPPICSSTPSCRSRRSGAEIVSRGDRRPGRVAAPPLAAWPLGTSTGTTCAALHRVRRWARPRDGRQRRRRMLLLAAFPSKVFGVVSLGLLASFTAVSMTIVTTGFGVTLSRGFRSGLVWASRAGARGDQPRLRRLVLARRARVRAVPLLGGFGEIPAVPPGRAARPQAASSVAPVSQGYERSLRPCLGTSIAPWRRALSRQTLQAEPSSGRVRTRCNRFPRTQEVSDGNDSRRLSHSERQGRARARRRRGRCSELAEGNALAAPTADTDIAKLAATAELLAIDFYKKGDRLE